MRYTNLRFTYLLERAWRT